MKKSKLKVLVAALAITLVGGLFVGCESDTSTTKTTADTTKTVEKISGNITSLGSTALQPLAEQAAKDFATKNPDATINVQGGGSGAGLNQVAAGTIEIGNSDVKAEDKIKDATLIKDLVDHEVCALGFAVVVNKDVKVDSLTKEQIQGIFTGKYTNWNQVGGDDLAINVINRPASSGTRATFKSTVMDKQDEKSGLGTTQDSSGAVDKAIEATKGSISYLAYSYLVDKSTIKMLKIDGVEYSIANIKNNTYPFWSYEHMYTKGEPTGLTKAFIEYMMSAEVKPLMDTKGYISVVDLK